MKEWAAALIQAMRPNMAGIALPARIYAFRDLGTAHASAGCTVHMPCDHSELCMVWKALQLVITKSPGMGMPGFQPLGMLGIFRPGGSCGAAEA